MKIVGIIILVVILSVLGALAAIGIRAKRLWDNITLDWNLNNITILDVLSEMSKPGASVDIPINILIDNNNNEKVDLTDFSEVSLKTYYNGTLVAEVKKESISINSLVFQPLSKGNTIPAKVTLYKNKETGKLISEVISKNNPVVNIVINTKYSNVQLNPINKGFNYTIKL